MILFDYDPSKTLRDPKAVFDTFISCLREGDDVAAREVLAAGLRHMNKAKFSRRHGIPRRTLYNFLNEPVSPSLELVAKVCRAIRTDSAR